jgi:hypothetical protein
MGGWLKQSEDTFNGFAAQIFRAAASTKLAMVPILRLTDGRG